MVWRGCFGQKGSRFGGWISKPGYDVLLASPGDFLLDTDSMCFQMIQQGDTRVVSGANLSAGTYSTTVSLPSEYSGTSRLFVFGTGYSNNITDGGTYVNGRTGNDVYYGVTSGAVLTLTAVLYGGYTSLADTVWDIRISWTVLRAQY